MDKYEIIKMLYTSRCNSWINDVDDIVPIAINHTLMMDGKLARYVAILDRYVFTLAPRKWLLLANLIIPKQLVRPFVKYIKSNDDGVDDELLIKIADKLNIKGNDMLEFRRRMMLNRDELCRYARAFGMNKKYFKNNGLEYREKKKEGLDRWI